MDSNIIDGTPVKDHQYVRKGPHNDRARFLGVLPLQSIGSLFEQTEMSLHSLHPRPPSHPKKKKNNDNILRFEQTVRLVKNRPNKHTNIDTETHRSSSYVSGGMPCVRLVNVS